jgi:hypothetical protein
MDSLKSAAPETEDDWAQVTSEALQLLSQLPSVKLDMKTFWEHALLRAKTLAIDSLDVCVYLFREGIWERWLNPYADMNMIAFTPAQRYAAAVVLAGYVCARIVS